MDLYKQKKNPGCNVSYEAPPKDINNTGYDEASAKYIIAPKKHFNLALKEALDKWEKRI